MSTLLENARELHAKLQTWKGADLKSVEDKLGVQHLKQARDQLAIGALEEEHFDRVSREDALAIGEALKNLRQRCADIADFVRDSGGVVPFNTSKEAQDALTQLDETAAAVQKRAQHACRMMLTRAWNEACPYSEQQLQAMQADPTVSEDAAWLLKMRRASREIATQIAPHSSSVLRREFAREDEIRERASRLDGRQVPEAVQAFINRATSSKGAKVEDLTDEVVTWLNDSGAYHRVRVRMEQ